MNYDSFFAKKLQGIHGNIAEGAWPNGGVLICDKCKREIQFSSKEGGYYLKNGWPECCGQTMAIK